MFFTNIKASSLLPLEIYWIQRIVWDPIPHEPDRLGASLAADDFRSLIFSVQSIGSL